MMSPPRMKTGRRNVAVRRVVAPLLIVAAWWAATAWASRQPRQWLISTDMAILIGLLLTHTAVWWVAALHSSRPRIVAFRAFAVSLALACGLLLLEMPAAAHLIDYERVRETLTGPEGPGVGFVSDPDLSFRRAPNAHWTGRPRTDMASYFNLPFRSERELTFSTDAHGFRNLGTPDRADIALVGDSYVEGITVSDDETAAVRLHNLTGLSVADLGVAGYGTLQELVVLRKYALPLHPSMVAWFFFEGNDLDDDQNFENAMSYHPPPGAAVETPPAWRLWRGVVERSFTRNAWLELRQATDWFVPNRLDTFGWFRDRTGRQHTMYFFDFYATRPFTDYEARRLVTTRDTLRQGAALAKAQGTRLVMIYVPIKFRVYGSYCTFPAGSPCSTWRPWDVERRLETICREEGIEFVSLTDSMRDAARGGELLYVPADSHWNAAGHAFVARQVAALWAGGGTSATLAPRRP